jgi:hypothetical protein
MTKKQLFLAAVALVFPLTALPLLAFPVAALAQGGPGPGAGRGPGAAAAQDARGPRGNPELMEKRMRLARTLGLAEALDLEPEQALKLGQAVAKFDERRLATRKQLHEARAVLRRAAQGEKVAAAEIDKAIQQSLDARAQMAAIDRELAGVVTKDLAPEKKARAVLFLSKFQRRFGGPGMHRGMGPGGGFGPGDGRGRGPRGGFGMGPGGTSGPMMGMAAPPPADDDWDDDEE